MKILFDSHTHINNDGYSEEERAQLIAAIEDSEVAYVMDVGFDLPSGQSRTQPCCRGATRRSVCIHTIRRR